MIRLRALLMGAALMTGVSALASAQPLPQSNWSYAGRNDDHARGRDHDRDGRAYGYYNRDRDDDGYGNYNRDRDDRGYNQGYYSRDYDRRWRDRDDRGYRDRDDWNYRQRDRDWDHDGDRR